MRRLVVAEYFYSMQGEGPTAGTPAVFLRLAGCNMLCRFQRGDGTVALCDTVEVWRHGTPVDIGELLAMWKRDGLLDRLASGAHLVVTGGEPLLQQEMLAEVLEQLRRLIPRVVVEVETNATVEPLSRLKTAVAQWNCSPKLSSSGVERHIRYKPDALQYFAAQAQTRRAVFKFVISRPQDVEEVVEEYVSRFAIPRTAVCLMPEGASRSELEAKRGWVAQLALQHGFCYTDRLHIVLWDKATGV